MSTKTTSDPVARARELLAGLPEQKLETGSTGIHLSEEPCVREFGNVPECIPREVFVDGGDSDESCPIVALVFGPDHVYYASLFAQAPDLIRDLLADVERMERERDGLREALNTLHTWADGFENPRSGMGSGLHAEMYPTLSPSTRRYLLQMTRDAMTKGPADGRDE